MGDLEVDNLDPIAISIDVAQVGVNNPELRDETYCQLIKQITNNPDHKSTMKSWELITIVLYSFPPTRNFESYFMAFIESYTTNTNMEINIVSRFCLKIINRLKLQVGPVKTNVPSKDDIIHLRKLPFLSSPFILSLEEIMEHQKTNNHRELEVPWILVNLTKSIFDTNGFNQTGIFRIQAKPASVATLRKNLENDHFYVYDGDISHVPCNLLKHWLKELSEPLIPNLFYSQIIAQKSNIDQLRTIINEFPPIHKKTLLYLLQFLRRIALESTTKMDFYNLAVVLSPCLFRSPEVNDLNQMAQITSQETEVLELLIRELLD